MDTKNQKYIIRKDVAYLQVHGLPYVYINKGSGPESESAKYLTDSIAVKLLEEKPDRAEVIIENPDFEESADSKKPKDPVVPKAKASTKSKAKKTDDPKPADPKVEPKVLGESTTTTDSKPGESTDDHLGKGDPNQDSENEGNEPNA